MTKPQSYRQTAVEQCFCLLVLCLPYYQSLLLAGISGMLSALLLTCLLIFVVIGSPTLYRTVVGHLKSFPLSWIAQVPSLAVSWISVPSHAVVQGPSLAPSFQRPPPIFS